MRPSHWRERHYPFGASEDLIPGPDWLHWRTQQYPYGNLPSGSYAPPPGTFAPSLATKLNREFGAMPSGVYAPPPGTFAPSLATKLNMSGNMYPLPDYGQKRASLMGLGGGIFDADFLKGFAIGTMTGIVLSYTRVFERGFRR